MSTLDKATIAQLAEYLENCQLKAQDTPKITDQHSGMDWDDAYDVQDAVLARKTARGARMVGYKAGLTSFAKMKQMGVSEPVFGFLVDEFAVPEGAAIKVSELIHPKVEPEICFVTKTALKGPGCHVGAVLAACDFVLAGIDNVGFRQNYGNIGRALQGVPPDSLTMLLAHDPTFWDKAVVGKQPVDVMLSGHTHGGQVALNVMGFTVSPANFVYEQVAGLYKKGNQLLYVNSGIGTVGPPARIGVPPEITVFTLKSALKMSSANA